MASIERQRTVRQNPPAGVRGRQLASRRTPESSVSVQKRMEEYPNQSLLEPLIVGAGLDPLR
eukprot:1989817-Pleurochrysis_carterae.AAC.1